MIRVVTFGTLDVFHIGHFSILERPRELDNYLSVGDLTDELNLSNNVPEGRW